MAQDRISSFSQFGIDQSDALPTFGGNVGTLFNLCVRCIHRETIKTLGSYLPYFDSDQEEIMFDVLGLRLCDWELRRFARTETYFTMLYPSGAYRHIDYPWFPDYDSEEEDWREDFYEEDYYYDDQSQDSEWEDQMYRSKLDYNQLQLLNLMIENEKDRTLCKKILMKAEITSNDVLNLKLPGVELFKQNCENYGIKLDCTFIGNDDRKTLIQQMKTVSVNIVEKKNFNVETYVISGSLCVNKFLFDIKKLNKGEQHKQCTKLVHSLNDKWLSTFYHNSNNDCRQLILLFRRLNIESSIKTMSKFEKKLKYYHKVIGSDMKVNEFLNQFEDQMFSLYSDTKRAVEKIEKSSDV